MDETLRRAIEARAAEVDGITLHMQPVQDLTVEDRVSRTQFQYTLEDADPEELNRWAHEDGGYGVSVIVIAKYGPGDKDFKGIHLHPNRPLVDRDGMFREGAVS
mgnify:CR=1 FL=1